MDVLDRLSFDVCVTTPDHFFSLLSSRVQDDTDTREIIARARSALSGDCLSPELSALLHSYPSSIVALSLTYSMSPSSFIIDQIKSFVRHKKDATPYFVSRPLYHTSGDSIFCSLSIDTTAAMHSSASKRVVVDLLNSDLCLVCVCVFRLFSS